MRRVRNTRWAGVLNYAREQWPTLVLSTIAILLSWRANCVSTEQKELSRLDHLPNVELSLRSGPDADNLVVANKGYRLRKMEVDSRVFFDVLPCIQPCERPAPLLRYIVDDYYRDVREGDYEGSQGRVYGLAQPSGTSDFLGSVSRALQDSLTLHGRRWQGIEVRRAIKVVYWDWVGVKEEKWFSDERSQPAFDPISRNDWKRYVVVADSLRRAHRRLLLGTVTPDADRQRVVDECVSAAR